MAEKTENRGNPRHVIAAVRNTPVSAGVVIAIHVGLLAWSAIVHSPAGDEVGHFAAGRSHWQLNRFDLYCVNPPLVRMVATLPAHLTDGPVNLSQYRPEPYFRSEFQVGRQWMAANPNQILPAFKTARLACLPFSILGGLTCFFWAFRLYGARSAIAALVLWSFSPTILGHGALMTPDVPAAAMGLLASLTFYRAVQTPLWRRWVLAGLFLGLALLTKLTWVVLVPIWSATVAIQFLTKSRQPAGPHYSIRLAAGRLFASFGIALITVNAGYLFEGTLTPLKDYEFSSRAFGGDPDFLSPDRNGFRNHWAGNLPVPLPRNFLAGIDHIKFEYERGYESYLAGQRKHGGWWYYYLYALGVKLPVGTLILIVFSIGLILFRALEWKRREGPTGLGEEVFLLSHAVIVIGLVSSETGFNHHMRYFLPAFPFLFVLASGLWRARGQFGGALRGTATAALLWSAIGSLAVCPESLSYFNELAGGPSNGWQHLDKSNLDWGQDLIRIKAWQCENPDARPLFVATSGFVDARMLGVDATMIDGTSNLEAPGWYAIGTTCLVNEKRLNASFGPVEPVSRLGYTIRIYRVQ